MVSAGLLLALPGETFMLPVPALIGFATALFAAAPMLGRWSLQQRVSVTGKGIAGSVSLAAVMVFIVKDAVIWAGALPMLIGASLVDKLGGTRSRHQHGRFHYDLFCLALLVVDHC